MIKRFIKSKSITVTHAINEYDESCSAIRTSVIDECYWISSQHVRLKMSRTYQEYLRMSDAHVAQIQLELQKRCSGMGESNVDFDGENVGNSIMGKSIMSCGKIISAYSDLEFCIPLPNGETIQLAHDLIKYTGEYDWLKNNYKFIPFGKLLYSDLIEKMKAVFNGRIPGKYVWHTKN